MYLWCYDDDSGCFHTVVTKLIEVINSQNVLACTAVITIVVS